MPSPQLCNLLRLGSEGYHLDIKVQLSAALFALHLFLFLFWSHYYKYYYKLEQKKNNNLTKDKCSVASNSLESFIKTLLFITDFPYSWLWPEGRLTLHFA